MKIQLNLYAIIMLMAGNAHAANWRCDLWGQSNAKAVDGSQTLLGQLEVDSSDHRSEKRIEVIKGRYVLSCKGMTSPQGNMFACGFFAPGSSTGYADAWVPDSALELHMHTQFDGQGYALYCWAR